MADIKTGSIEINGLADLEKRLLDFPDKLARNILGGAIRAGAVVIQREAKELAPRSEDFHILGKGSKRILIAPGHLKRNIRVRLAPRKQRDVPITDRVYVRRLAGYWKFIELGKSGYPAASFMRKAFDTMKEKALERVREYLAARIAKEAAKL